MMDDDDIFSSVNEFCKDNKLEEDFRKIGNLNQNFFSSDSTSDTLNELISDSKVTSFSKRPSRTVRQNKTSDKSMAAVASTSKEIQNNPGSSTSRPRRTRNKQTEKTNNTNIPTSTPSTSSLPDTSQSSQADMSILQHILESQSALNLGNTPHQFQSRSSKRKSTSNRRTRNNSETNLLRNNFPFAVPKITQTSRNRNARRNCVGEIAARAQVVEYVDLVSSPVVLPQNIGVINVDSDEEAVANKSIDTSVENIDEIERTPLKVKVKWGKKIEVFPYRKYQKFSDIIKYFTELEKVGEENICLNLGDRIISENDTPESINYEIHMFIHGRMVKDYINPVTSHNNKDVSLIEIKIQCDGRKRPIIMSLRKSNTFSVLYAKCAEEFQVPVSNIILSFDGEHLKASSKPEELDFEGGEVIDCKIKS